jgi:hypothetical protein
MIYGDQWICRCGTHNLELRVKCRECGQPKGNAVGHETAKEVLERFNREGDNHGNEDKDKEN